MAHQLSGDDEHLNGAVNQYNGCCLFRSRRRGGIGSIRYCRNLLSSSLYAGLRIQYWTSSNDCPQNGEQNYKATGKTFFQGLFFLSGLAILLCLLVHAISPYLLKQLISSPEIYQAVDRYLDWRSFGLLFSFPFLAIRSFFVGITHTKALSWSAVTAVAINIPLNYFLIFTLELGISGAAIASSLAEMDSLIVLCIYTGAKIDKEKYGLKPVYDGRLLFKVLNLSVWSMLHAFISVAPWFLFSWQSSI